MSLHFRRKQICFTTVNTIASRVAIIESTRLTRSVLFQRLANEMCKEFFPPELQWKELSSAQVDQARDAMENRDRLLEGRPDLAHWFISKYHRSASYIHVRQGFVYNAIAGAERCISVKDWKDRPHSSRSSPPRCSPRPMRRARVQKIRTQGRHLMLSGMSGCER